MYFTKNASQALALQTKPTIVYHGKFFLINQLSDDFVSRHSFNFSKVVHHVKRIYQESGLLMQTKELDKSHGENPLWQGYKNRVKAGNLVEAYVRITDASTGAYPGYTGWSGYNSSKEIYTYMSDSKVGSQYAIDLRVHKSDLPLDKEYRVAYVAAHEGLHQYFNWADNYLQSGYLKSAMFYEGHYTKTKEAHLNMSGPKIIENFTYYPASERSNLRHPFEKILDFQVEVIKGFAYVVQK